MNETTNNNQTPQTSGSEPSPDQVANYLRQHSDFFQQHTELLKQLTVPHQTENEAGKSVQTVSLIERQVRSLREENGQLRNRLSELIANAKTNDALFEKARGLVLRLISAPDFEAIKIQVEQAMHEDFGSDCCLLWLVHQQPNIDNLGVKALQQIQQQAGRLISKDRIFCGILKEEESRFLFADHVDRVGSAAILPLYSHDQLVAILAIANEDENYYRNNMSTVLLEHIGQVIAEVIYRISDTPKLS